MRLTEKQLRVLMFALVRPTMSDWAFRDAWMRTVKKTKKGVADGNVLQGRVRTMRSLERAGLITGWNITDAGKAALRDYIERGTWLRGVRWMQNVPGVSDGPWVLRMLLPSGLVRSEQMRALLVELLGESS